MQREGVVQFALHHPNIVNLTEMFKEDGRLFLVMEYVNGGSFEGLLAKETLSQSRCI